MRTTRRGFVAAAGALVAGTLAARLFGRVDAAAAAGARALRPRPVGSSAGRCAHCGSASHATLDDTCPELVERRAALQASADRLRWRAPGADA